MRRVVLHVDRLVLKGFRHADADAFALGLREAITRRLAEPSAARRVAPEGDLRRIAVGRVRIGSGTRPRPAGARIGDSVAREISP